MSGFSNNHKSLIDEFDLYGGTIIKNQEDSKSNSNQPVPLKNYRENNNQQNDRLNYTTYSEREDRQYNNRNNRNQQQQNRNNQKNIQSNNTQQEFYGPKQANFPVYNPIYPTQLELQYQQFQELSPNTIPMAQNTPPTQRQPPQQGTQYNQEYPNQTYQYQNQQQYIYQQPQTQPIQQNIRPQPQIQQQQEINGFQQVQFKRSQPIQQPIIQQITSIEVQTRQSMDSTQAKFDLMHDLVDLFFGNSDIEIKFTNPQQHIVQNIEDIRKKYCQLNLKINYDSQSEENRLAALRIYQFKGQQDNSITQLDQMIYIHSQLLEDYYNKAEQQKLIILINFQGYQYKIDPQYPQFEDAAKLFFLNFKATLDKNVVLFYQCKSNLEATAKSKVLNHQRIEKNLQTELKCKKVALFATSAISLDIFDHCAPLQSQAENIKNYAAQVIFIAQNNSVDNVNGLQIKFNNFINDSQNIKTIREEFEIIFSLAPDQNEVDQNLLILQESEQNVEIITTTPQINIQIGKYLVSVLIMMWIEGYQQETVIAPRIKQLKAKIEQIYLPNIVITVKDENQIKVWQDFLCSKYENKNNNKECQTKNLSQNKMIIELSGDQDSILKKKTDIENDLETYKNVIIILNGMVPKNLLQQLQNKQYNKLFKKTFSQISQEFGESLIRITDVNAQNQSIYFQAIFNSDIFSEENIEEALKQDFIDKLAIYDQKFDYDELLKFLLLKDYQFQEQFQVIVKQTKNDIIIVGMQNNIDEIKSFVSQIDKKKQQSQQSHTFEVPNRLILNKLKSFHQDNKLELEDGAQIVFTQDSKIVLTQEKQKLQKAISTIHKIMSDLDSLLIVSPSGMSEREVGYIFKKLQPTVSNLEKKHPIIIDFSSTSQSQLKSKKSIAQSINYSNKELSIVFADISKIECDAIVNSCNNKMSFGDPNVLSGVAQSIFEMAGTQYASFCHDYIRRYTELKVGQVLIYEMPQGRQINYILNVATPIYQTGNQTKKDLQDIQKNIVSIFKEADQLQLNSIALPILGGGACGYSFYDAATTVINEIINLLFSNQYSLKIVYLTEMHETRVTTLTDIMKSLVDPPKAIRQIKFQWQWQDGGSFKDYDDEDINKQIDEGYEQFQKLGTKTTIKLKFPYSKQPGTHTVNLQSGIIKDNNLNTELTIIEKTILNTKRFYINNEQVDDQLNEYLTLQQLNRLNQFSIFYKRHIVIFSSEGNYQINEETQFKRQIQGIQYKKGNSQAQQINILQAKKVQIQNFKFEKFSLQKQNTQQMTVQSFDGNLNKEILESLKVEIKKAIIEHKLTVPNLSIQDLTRFEDFIKSQAVKVIGQVQSGNTITIEIFKNKQVKIIQHIDSIKNSIKQYPIEWSQQNSNYDKVLLQQSSNEYIKIANQFKLTEQGTIYQIYRIQNKALWDNYISEKNKLIDIYKQQGQHLKPLEQERYLWHGVRGSHPNVVYSGLKEAFDQTYSNIGMWGPGIYFAENASYSRHYSYKLTSQDDPNNAGRLVFLCCLITTGRVEVKQPDQNIKRPSQGYDCVSGFTNGSNVYILYSMDIRRAYPAYEIIYT